MSGVLPAVGLVAGLSAATLDDIARLERQCFPAPREAFLQCWLSPPNRSLAHRAGNAVDACAVLRECHDGTKIGPLFADSAGAAIDVLDALVGLVHVDVPTLQTDWLAALAARGFTVGFRTTRMYRGPAPAIDLDRVFGVTSLELG